MTFKRYVLIAFLVGIVAGLAWYFLKPPKRDIDQEKITDARVENWAKQYEQEDAIAFLERGGLLCDKNPLLKGMDKDVALPFVKRLKEKTGNTAVVFLFPEDRKLGGAAAIPIPKDPLKLAALKTFMLEEERAFDGIIVRSYGQQWLQFEFLDAKMAKAGGIETWEVE